MGDLYKEEPMIKPIDVSRGYPCVHGVPLADPCLDCEKGIPPVEDGHDSPYGNEGPGSPSAPGGSLDEEVRRAVDR